MIFLNSLFQKKRQDEKKPLEEKIKTLKKRNAELAAIARRLEEKAKHLQQENIKVDSILLNMLYEDQLNKLHLTKDWYEFKISQPYFFFLEK